MGSLEDSEVERLEATFTVERDTKNTRRYQEEVGEGPPFCGTLYLQKWALKQLGGGELPERVRVVVTVDRPESGGTGE